MDEEEINMTALHAHALHLASQLMRDIEGPEKQNYFSAWERRECVIELIEILSQAILSTRA